MIEIEMLKEYKIVNETVERLKADLKAKREEFEASHEGLIANIKMTSEDLAGLKANITADALEEFKEFEQKQMLGGIGVRVSEDLSYDDKDALDWGIEHGLCLSLDKAAFKKIAKIQTLSFVKKTEKLSITFPKELKLE